jgi:hypothetical protein
MGEGGERGGRVSSVITDTRMQPAKRESVYSMETENSLSQLFQQHQHQKHDER